jgi:hypothetical protein
VPFCCFEAPIDIYTQNLTGYMEKNMTVVPTIYIQIAAYRDPELLSTLKNCLDTAERPENLRFGIAWQHCPYDQWDVLDAYKTDSRFTILDIDYRDAKGPCWARHQLNLLYTNETYTLQLDSHHRFSQNWDTTLIDMLEKLRTTECPKPLLSTYLPSFDPATEERAETPWIMQFDRFAPEGPVHFLPHSIDNWKELTAPIPSRFVSGHFIFADGVFCKEVEYDPTYYFHGEEINLSVRSYMAGYDMFTPHFSVIWHEYTRNNKKKHWDDSRDWASLDNKSYAHNKEVLGIGGATEKTLVKHIRSLRTFPIHNMSEQDFEAGLLNFHRMCIDVYRPAFTETDYTLWAVAFEDKNGVEIYRQDADRAEIDRLLSVPLTVDKFIHLWRNFYAEALPATWVIWPHSESKGWTDRLTGEFRV